MNNYQEHLELMRVVRENFPHGNRDRKLCNEIIGMLESLDQVVARLVPNENKKVQVLSADEIVAEQG